MADKQKTILIVDDEEDLRDMYTIVLKSRGFEVLQAVNGFEALEWLERDYARIDLILLDVVMPGMDGFETLEKIKENEKFSVIPVIIFTNLDNEEDKKRASENAIAGYFVKSQHVPSELAEKISKILEK